MKKSALLLVDLQNDFCPGGSMAVKEGDLILSPINNMLHENGNKSYFHKVVATADWHPQNHISFASEHEGHEEYEQIEVGGLTQNLWPDHCVAGTEGADLHPELEQKYVDLILHKGTQVGLDSYSAFFENDGETPTGLHGYLQEFDIKDVYIVGLALDWCVYFSAVDARRLAYNTVVVQDLSRPVDVPAGFAAQRLEDMQRRGIQLIKSENLNE